jgi:uncharacterized membrane protein YfhO
MQKRQVILILLLVSTATLLQGCVAAAVGAGAAGTVAYIRGDLESVEPKNINTVYQATVKAMEQLELNVSNKTKDSLSAEIVARDSQDKKVTVKLGATAEGATKLSIRIGIFGSETKSRLIYEQIKKNLK